MRRGISKMDVRLRVALMLAVIGLLVVSRGLSPGLAIPASAPSDQMSFSVPSTSNSETCVQKISHVTALLSLPTAQQNAGMLSVAESSSQFAAFAQQVGIAPSLVDGGPSVDYATNNDCSVVDVEAFSYTFVAAGRQFTISIDPSTMAIVGKILDQPTVSFGGIQDNNSASGRGWGGGYSFYNGTSDSDVNDDYPWSFIQGEFDVPTVYTGDTAHCDSSYCIFSIWAGLTNVEVGQYYIAQTGVDMKAEVNLSPSSIDYMWTEWYDGGGAATECTTHEVNASDSITSDVYTEQYASDGSNESYVLDTFDNTGDVGCLNSLSPYDWSSGLGSASYFAVLTGEYTDQAMTVSMPSFTSTTITGNIIDNVYNGGPSGHCINTPYSNYEANAYYDGNGTAKATESDVNSSCQFTIHFIP